MRVHGLRARPRRRRLPQDDGLRSVIADNMLGATHSAGMARVQADGTSRHAVKINRTDLYRELTHSVDMARVVGRSSALL